MYADARPDTPIETALYIDLTQDTDIEEELDQIASRFDNRLLRPIQQPLPPPGTLRAFLVRTPLPPTPPLGSPPKVRNTAIGVDLSAISERGNRNNEEEEGAGRNPRLLAPKARIVTEEYKLEGEGPTFHILHGPRRLKSFCFAKEIWNTSLYYETNIQAAFKQELTKNLPVLQRLQTTEKEFSRILLTVAHITTLASADYQAEVLKKPSRHPEGLHNVWPGVEARNIPIGELLAILVKGPVQVHEDLRIGTNIQNGTTYGVEYAYPLPVSDFSISPSHLIVALNFLAQIGVLHVSIGHYERDREFPLDRYTDQYLLKLSILDSIATKQPVGPTYKYPELPEGHTLFFSVVWEHDYAWYGLLKSVLGTYVRDTYSLAGFDSRALLSDYDYNWMPLRNPYWCPVLLREANMSRTQVTYEL